MIRPGTVKSLNAPWELSQLALRRDYAKKIDPCRMLVCLGLRTVQNVVILVVTRIGSVHAFIWLAVTNWAGPVRIQSFYGPECVNAV